jgi:hypothetical protein
MIIQFNWCELNSITKLPDSKIILMFCLYINKSNPLERKISNNHSMLQKKLHIGNSYSALSAQKYILNSRNGIFSNYICAEPQSYLTNCSFLHAKVAPQLKSDYLYILGQRSLNNHNNWVPEEYVEKHHLTNPFITHYKSKIIFTLEKPL